MHTLSDVGAGVWQCFGDAKNNFSNQFGVWRLPETLDQLYGAIWIDF